MTFMSQSLTGSLMNWNGRAKATIDVQSVDTCSGKIIHLFEKGQFCSDCSDSSFPFSNTFKLVCQSDTIAFYHERFGAQNPVWLFDLVAISHNTLINKAVHQCVQDQYTVLITLNEKDIEMQWNIIGPRKNEKINYHYFLKHL